MFLRLTFRLSLEGGVIDSAKSSASYAAFASRQTESTSLLDATEQRRYLKRGLVQKCGEIKMPTHRPSSEALIHNVLSVLKHETANKRGELYIRSVCFSPDGKYLATGAEDGIIRVCLPSLLTSFLTH